MKTYPKGANLSIPYLTTNTDGTTDRAWARISFPPMCKRALKKYLRKWIKLELGRSLAEDEQRTLLKRVKPIE